MNAKVNEKADMILHGRASEEFTIKAVEAAAKRSGNPAGFLRAVLRQVTLYERDSVWNGSERIDAIKDVLLSLVDDYEVNSVEANRMQENRPDNKEDYGKEKERGSLLGKILADTDEGKNRIFSTLRKYADGGKPMYLAKLLVKAEIEGYLQPTIQKADIQCLGIKETQAKKVKENTTVIREKVYVGGRVDRMLVDEVLRDVAGIELSPSIK